MEQNSFNRMLNLLVLIQNSTTKSYSSFVRGSQAAKLVQELFSSLYNTELRFVAKVDMITITNYYSKLNLILFLNEELEFLLELETKLPEPKISERIKELTFELAGQHDYFCPPDGMTMGPAMVSNYRDEELKEKESRVRSVILEAKRRVEIYEKRRVEIYEKGLED